MDPHVVYVGGLHPGMAVAHLEKLMGPYGAIDGLRLIVDDDDNNNSRQHRGHDGDRRRCYGFCRYSDRGSAVAAIASLDGRMLLGKRLNVQPAVGASRGKSNDGPSITSSSSSIGFSCNDTCSNDKKRTLEREMHHVDARITAIRRKLCETAGQRY